jgi:glycerophosphoryl diester phosphodiesterase
MGGSAEHPWFASTTGLAVMSHNGSALAGNRSGTLTAFIRAYDSGYRWFQVDVVPIKGDLISRHAIFGRKRGFAKLDRAAITTLLPNVPTLGELLTHDELRGARWNIEMKSKAGLGALLSLLRSLKAQGHNLSGVMISSPVRPSVLKTIAEEFEEVALAAPVLHGGMIGVRFLGPSRARTSRREYDCEQLLTIFVRARRAKGVGPVRQAWTISKPRTLQRVLDKDVIPIVDSERLLMRRGFVGGPRKQTAIPPAKVPTPLPRVEVLALGGGWVARRLWWHWHRHVPR